MSRRVVRSALLALPAVLVLTGCSEGTPDVGSAEGADGAREVVVVLAEALPTGDGARVCSLLAPPAQRRLEERWGEGSCLAAVRSSSRELGTRARTSLADGDLEVEVDGETARVTGRAAATLARVLEQESLELSRVEEHWVVS